MPRKKSMKQQIYDHVASVRECTWATLEAAVPGFSARLDPDLDNANWDEWSIVIKSSNLWVWGGMTKGAHQAMVELVNDRLIGFQCVGATIYQAHGRTPIHKKAATGKNWWNHHYKSQMWLPTVLFWIDPSNPPKNLVYTSL
jgi:hypothetical protein